MDLPNYFLADLPADAPLSPTMVTEACQTLKRNRERYLEPRRTESIIHALANLARWWLDPACPHRQRALDEGPAATGFSREVLASGLDALFAQLTARNLTTFVVQEFGHPERLDRLTSNDGETRLGIASSARGPALLVHLTGGAVPTAAITSMLHGLLVRAAQFVKCASGHSYLPRLFAHSLHETEPKLASCLEVAEWKGGSRDLEQALFAEADCATATGTDQTMDAVRRALPGHVRLLTYGHRVSFAYVARDGLGTVDQQQTLRSAAEDVAAWDQLGCLSPHVIYVENGGGLAPEQFAAELAERLDQLERSHPRGPVDIETAAAISRRREFYQVRAAASNDTKCWYSGGSTAWSVVFESDPEFQFSCLHRFIYVKAVDTLEQCLHAAEKVRGKVSTCGLAAVGTRLQDLANHLARWGVTRLCPLGHMQRPPPGWRHDGRPALGDLVTWTDHEQPVDR